MNFKTLLAFRLMILFTFQCFYNKISKCGSNMNILCFSFIFKENAKLKTHRNQFIYPNQNKDILFLISDSRKYPVIIFSPLFPFNLFFSQKGSHFGCRL